MKVKLALICCFILLLLSFNSIAQRMLQEDKNKSNWQYIYPFKDKSYFLGIQQIINIKNNSDEFQNAFLYFGRKEEKVNQIFWKVKMKMCFVIDNVKYEDFNRDGLNDVLLFESTGGRGANEFYNLFLVSEKNHTLTRVKGFNEITNPTYHIKHKVILGYGFAGANYYSIYRIDKNNKVYQISESFEDNEGLDLDQKILDAINHRK